MRHTFEKLHKTRRGVYVKRSKEAEAVRYGHIITSAETGESYRVTNASRDAWTIWFTDATLVVDTLSQ